MAQVRDRHVDRDVHQMRRGIVGVEVLIGRIWAERLHSVGLVVEVVVEVFRHQVVDWARVHEGRHFFDLFEIYHASGSFRLVKENRQFITVFKQLASMCDMCLTGGGAGFDHLWMFDF